MHYRRHASITWSMTYSKETDGMNKIYSKVWSTSLNQLVVASELASADGGSASGKGVARGPVLHRWRPIALAMATLTGMTLSHSVDAQTVIGCGKTSNVNIAAIVIGADCYAPTRLTSPTNQSHGIVIGSNGNASGVYPTVVGDYATGIGDWVSAFGRLATANGQAASAYGYMSRAVGSSAVAIGDSANATGQNAIAIGGRSLANGGSAIAMGVASNATGLNALALGNTAVATGNWVTAVGYLANATGSTAMAMGYGAKASGSSASAFGDRASATGGYAMADGSFANALGTYATALGASSFANGYAATSVGYTARSYGAYASAFGTYANAVGTNSTALGYLTFANGTYATAAGYSANATGILAVAMGSGAKALGNQATVIGSHASAIGDYATSLGYYAQANSVTATAVGAYASVAGLHSIGVGYGATDNGVANSAVLGMNASIAAGLTGSNVALGQGSAVAAAGVPVPNATINGTSYTFAGGTPGGVVSVGSATVKRQITNVAAGQLSGTSTDAVNGSQLFATNQQVNSIGSQVTSLSNQVNNGGMGLVVQDPNTNNITVAATKNGKVVDVTGTEGARTISGVANGTADSDAATVAQLKAIGITDPTNGGTLAVVKYDDLSLGKVTLGGAGGTVLTNVAAGQLNGSSTDAVNGSQLFATNQNVSSIDGRVTTIDSQVTNLTNQVNNGGLGLVQQDASTNVITVGASKAGSKVDVTGTDGARTISGVANGTADSDAATVAQLKAVGITDPTNGGTLAVVKYDDLTLNKATLGGANGTVLTNVADGQVVAGSKDAVNGSQLYATNQALNSLTSGTAGPFVSNGSASNTQPVAGGANAVAGGFGATAGGAGSTVLGNQSTDNGVANSTVLGQGASIASGLAGSHVALGQGSTVAAAAVPTSEVTLQGTKYTFAGATPVGVVSVGNGTTTRQITNVAAGQLTGSSTDAVNGSQLFATNQALDKLVTGAVGPFVADGTSGNTQPVASGADAVAGGFGASATGAGSLAIGGQATDNGVANATVLGKGASIASGVGGSNVALGQGSTVDADAMMVPGEIINGTSYSFAGGMPGGVVSVGSANVNRQITHVAAGQLSDTSTDAVNGSQLYATNQQVDAVGGQVTDIDGRVTNIDNRITNIDGQVTDLTNQVNNGGLGLVQQDASTGTITVAAGKNGSKVDVSGTDGARTVSGVANGVADSDAATVAQLKAVGPKDPNTGDTLAAVKYDDLTLGKVTLGGSSGTVLTNVADGQVAAGSKDAVNGSQLNATNQQVAAVDNRVTNIDGRVTNIDGQVTNLTNQVSNGGIGLVQQDASTGVITVAAAKGGSKVDVSGTAGARTIAGVANGVADSDAVTVAQLKAVSPTDPTNGGTLAVVKYDSVALGKITLGGSGGTVIDNLASGAVAVGSKQAVNGGQLYDMQQYFQGKYDYLSNQYTALTTTVNNYVTNGGGSGGGNGGGGATGSNSSQSGGGNASGDNSVSIGQGSTATGDGGTAIGQGSTTTGNDGTAIGHNAQAIADNSVALGAGSIADRPNSVSVGTPDAPRQITNVAPATERTDAPNWGQVQDAIGDAQRWNTQRFREVNRKINRMGAMTAAYGQMAFSAQGLETDNRVGVGVGSQAGAGAIAVGYSRRINPNLNVSFGASASGHEVSVGGGMSLGW
jgi:autotransporter adhesin